MFGCCNKKSLERASARVVDGKLILSLPAAQTPVVWQMDLTHAKASALEVLHEASNDTYGLHLKTPKGEKVDVALFDSRDKALEGLMAASNALESAHGLIRGGSEASGDTSAAKAPPLPPEQKKSRAGIIILAIIALIVIFTFWSAQMPVPVGGAMPSMQTMSNNMDSQSTSGVPLSADAYLSGR